LQLSWAPRSFEAKLFHDALYVFDFEARGLLYLSAVAAAHCISWRRRDSFAEFVCVPSVEVA
jgi:hypothetical protein